MKHITLGEGFGHCEQGLARKGVREWGGGGLGRGEHGKPVQPHPSWEKWQRRCCSLPTAGCPLESFQAREFRTKTKLKRITFFQFMVVVCCFVVSAPTRPTVFERHMSKRKNVPLPQLFLLGYDPDLRFLHRELLKPRFPRKARS